MVNFTLESNIEAPKKFNIPIFLEKRCQELSIICVVTCTDIIHGRIDKLLGIKREFIKFKLEGTKENLETIQSELLELAKHNK